MSTPKTLSSDPPLPEDLHVTRRPDGEEFVILPPKVEAQLAQFALTTDFWFVSSGYYPKAEALLRNRPEGSTEPALIYCAAGKAWVKVRGKRHDLIPGELLLIPPGVPHSYGPDEENPWTIHWVSFRGSKAGEYQRQLPENQFILSVDPRHRAEVEHLFNQLHGLLREGLSDAHLICASKIVECLLATVLLRNQSLRAESSRMDDPVAAAVAIMRNRLCQAVTLGELSKAVHLSPPHFSRLFRRRMGASPVDYFIRLKMQRACQYLDMTGQPIKVIANNMGYPDVCYFTRVFKRVMGKTPQAYRLGK